MGNEVERPLLPAYEEPHLSPNDDRRTQRWRQILARSETFTVINVTLFTVTCIIWLSSLLNHIPGKETPETVFSPAQAAIEYKTMVFRTGLPGEKTEYQGPTEEASQAWEALYGDIAMTQIDRETAARLPNATAPTSYDSSRYLVQLDVFHTLHCLNLLRRRLYPDVYPPDDKGDEGIDHLEHCVESIRQSLQCFSDVSTIYWEWSEKTQRMLGNTKSTHTCRNFEKVQEWARDHSLAQEDDFLQYVPGAPLKEE